MRQIYKRELNTSYLPVEMIRNFNMQLIYFTVVIKKPLETRLKQHA